MRVVVELRIRIIALNLVVLLAEDLFFNCGYFDGLIDGLHFLVELLFSQLNRLSPDREELQKLFDGQVLRGCLPNPPQSVLESLHGHIPRFGAVTSTPDKGVLLNLVKFVDQDLADQILRTEVLFSLVDSLHYGLDNLEDELRYLTEPLLLLLLQAVDQSEYVVLAPLAMA